MEGFLNFDQSRRMGIRTRPVLVPGMTGDRADVATESNLLGHCGGIRPELE